MPRPPRIAILGNSGSGKSTLARRVTRGTDVRPIDLDEIYWKPDLPGVRRDPERARADLLARLDGHTAWVIEGCYEELIAHVLDREPMLVWLDPGVDVCQAHCRSRPWEPHKYASPEAQDRNLEMLLEWVADHYRRSGAMSYAAHRNLFDGYVGPRLRATGLAHAVRALGFGEDET